jgi:hypothetical protein
MPNQIEHLVPCPYYSSCRAAAEAPRRRSSQHAGEVPKIYWIEVPYDFL